MFILSTERSTITGVFWVSIIEGLSGYGSSASSDNEINGLAFAIADASAIKVVVLHE